MWWEASFPRLPLDQSLVRAAVGTFGDVRATPEEITLLVFKIIATGLQTDWKIDSTNLVLFIMCFWVEKLTSIHLDRWWIRKWSCLESDILPRDWTPRQKQTKELKFPLPQGSAEWQDANEWLAEDKQKESFHLFPGSSCLLVTDREQLLSKLRMATTHYVSAGWTKSVNTVNKVCGVTKQSRRFRAIRSHNRGLCELWTTLC